MIIETVTTTHITGKKLLVFLSLDDVIIILTFKASSVSTKQYYYNFFGQFQLISRYTSNNNMILEVLLDVVMITGANTIVIILHTKLASSTSHVATPIT